jgi:hypothetical protein
MYWKLIYCLLLVGLSAASHAGPIHDTFRGGVLGVPWGTPLDVLTGTYPNGDHMFAVTPGHRAYWVKEGTPFLSVPRPTNGVLYGLDENNRVSVVAIAFEFERALELRNTLTSLFGVPISMPSKGKSTSYGWKADNGIAVVVTEMGDAHQQIVWLVVRNRPPEK